MPLHFDKSLGRQGLRSTEEYLRSCKDGGAIPRFRGHEYFDSLSKAGIIVPGWSSVRVTCTAGGNDQSYFVMRDGKLEGMVTPPYSGKPGIHEPNDLLSLHNAPDGWDLERFMLPSKF